MGDAAAPELPETDPAASPAVQPAPPGERLFSRLRRVHGLLGATVLPAYLLWHLLRHAPARSGPTAWAVAAPTSHGLQAAVLVVVLVSLSLHACLGLGLAVARPRVSADPLEAGLRPHQIVSGALLAVFLVGHVWHVGLGVVEPASGPLTAYGVLWVDLGRPWFLLAYVVGISAAAFHAALGLSRLASAYLYEDHTLALQLVRLAVGLGAFALWFQFLWLLAHFAIGAPLLPG